MTAYKSFLVTRHTAKGTRYIISIWVIVSMNSKMDGHPHNATSLAFLLLVVGRHGLDYHHHKLDHPFLAYCMLCRNKTKENTPLYVSGQASIICPCLLDQLHHAKAVTSSAHVGNRTTRRNHAICNFHNVERFCFLYGEQTKAVLVSD